MAVLMISQKRNETRWVSDSDRAAMEGLGWSEHWPGRKVAAPPVVEVLPPAVSRDPQDGAAPEVKKRGRPKKGE